MTDGKFRVVVSGPGLGSCPGLDICEVTQERAWCLGPILAAEKGAGLTVGGTGGKELLGQAGNIGRCLFAD